MQQPEDPHNSLPPILNLDNMANGAVYEMLGDLMKKLAANISDPNTDAKATRTLTIKLKCKPYDDRSGFSYEAKVDAQLAGMNPATGSAYIARKAGEFLVVGKNHKQLEMELHANTPAETEDKPFRPQ